MPFCRGVIGHLKRKSFMTRTLAIFLGISGGFKAGM